MKLTKTLLNKFAKAGYEQQFGQPIQNDQMVEAVFDKIIESYDRFRVSIWVKTANVLGVTVNLVGYDDCHVSMQVSEKNKKEWDSFFSNLLPTEKALLEASHLLLRPDKIVDEVSHFREPDLQSLLPHQAQS